MRKRRLLLIITGASIVLYGFIFILLGINLFGVEGNYQNREIAYVEEVKKALGVALNSSDKKASLEELTRAYAMEVMVYEGEDVIYETLHLVPGQNRQDILNREAVLLEAAGDVELENGESVNVWYAIYHMPFTEYLTSVLSFQNILLLIAFLIIFVLVMVIQYVLLKPLYRIKESIEKLEKYEFEGIESGSDDINQRMAMFSKRLDHNIRAVERKNTELELSLQLERERLANIIQLSRALVHDLKSPVHQTLLENESRIEKLEEMQRETVDLGVYNINQNDKLLHALNDILKLLKEGAFYEAQEEFDFMAMVLETLKLFKTGMMKKNLYFHLEGPEEMPVLLNKISIQLLLHNIFSNMVQYATPETELIIEVLKKEKELQIKAINKSSEENILRMKKSEQLFHVVEEKRNEEYEYSSGNGLFLIKDLMFLLEGDYSYAVEGEDVILSLLIPLKEEMSS